MKTFIVDVTRRVTVSLDEAKFAAIMPDFNKCISDFGTDETAYELHARHIARRAVDGEDFSAEDFVEGYGIVRDAGIGVMIKEVLPVSVTAIPRSEKGGAA